MVALRPFVLLLAVVTLAGCGGSSSSQLVDGSQAPELPAELNGLEDAVLTRASIIPSGQLDQGRLADCDYSLIGSPTVVKRVTLEGESLTLKLGSSVTACDAIEHPAPDPDRLTGSPWCGGSVGKLVRGRLRDPRLDLCQAEGGEITGFAWVQPLPAARWIGVRNNGHTEVYEAAGSLPVRVTTVAGVHAARSAASFDIEEYDANGHKLRAYTLNAAVAG